MAAYKKNYYGEPSWIIHGLVEYLITTFIWIFRYEFLSPTQSIYCTTSFYVIQMLTYYSWITMSAVIHKEIIQVQKKVI